MRTRTLKQLKDRIRSLGEIRSQFVSDAELTSEINQDYLELYEKLISSGSDDYEESTQTIDVVSGTSSYPLPSDYFKTLGVDVKMNNGNYAGIDRYNKGQRNRFSVYKIGAVSREFSMYRIRGNNLTLTPEPNWSQVAGIRHLYVPVPKDLTDDNDTLDGICGWEDWVVYKSLIKFIGGKEEGDASTWMQLLSALDQRIEEMKPRDRGEPDTVRNVEEEESERLWPRFGYTE